jgi:hypothetical protein
MRFWGGEGRGIKEGRKEKGVSRMEGYQGKKGTKEGRISRKGGYQERKGNNEGYQGRKGIPRKEGYTKEGRIYQGRKDIPRKEGRKDINDEGGKEGRTEGRRGYRAARE